MKKKLIIAFILGLALFVARYVCVKSYGIHLSAERFIELAGDRDDAGSVYSLKFDGVRNDRAYLSSWKMHQYPKTILYWTEIDDYSPETRNEMLNGTSR